MTFKFSSTRHADLNILFSAISVNTIRLATMKTVTATQEDLDEARLAAAQAQALAQAGLDQRPPFQSHTRKLSFKDTLKRTFGLKPLNGSTDQVNLTRVNSAPTVAVIPASNANSSPDAIAVKLTPKPSAVEMVRTASSPPTMDLPPIPIDPALNAKDAKAQHKRLAKLAAEQKTSTLKPGMPDGTYGRSASMDVQRTPYFTPASVSETALPRSGYSSDSDATKGGKTGKGLSGLFKMDRPPTANNTRYGLGIEGGRPNNGRSRKLSWGRNSTSNAAGNSSSTGLGGGFFKHRKSVSSPASTSRKYGII